MPKAAVFTMKLEADLRAEFMAAAEASHRPASQVVRELMREFVERQQDRRDHTAYLQRKVDAARVSVHDGQGRSDKAVETDFAARRTRITDRA
jgi:predicted transcriptional regulator